MTPLISDPISKKFPPLLFKCGDPLVSCAIRLSAWPCSVLNCLMALRIACRIASLSVAVVHRFLEVVVQRQRFVIGKWENLRDVHPS